MHIITCCSVVQRYDIVKAVAITGLLYSMTKGMAKATMPM